MSLIKIRKFMIIILILLITITSAGCWDRAELEEQAFVIMMGIDKGKHPGTFNLTVMIAIPAKLAGGSASGGGGGGGKQEESVSIITMETPTIFGGLNSMNTFVSRRINLQHMKMLVIGEELARQGVQDSLGAIIRSREIRRNIGVMVGRPTAMELIKELQPKLGTSPTKYIEDILLMVDQTGAIPKSFYHRFLIAYETAGEDPIATIGTVRKKEQSDQEDNNAKLAGELKTDLPGVNNEPRQGGIGIGLAGTAVFRGQKMVGTLNGDETRIFNMIRGDFRRDFMTFRDPIQRDKAFSVDIRQGSQPRISVKIKDGQPYINLNLSLEGDLAGDQAINDYPEEPDKFRMLERMVAGNINERTVALIKKVQQQYKSDIFGFGNTGARQDFLTFQDWLNYKWLQKFKDAQVNVVVKFSIRRIGLNFGSPQPPPGEEGQ